MGIRKKVHTPTEARPFKPRAVAEPTVVIPANDAHQPQAALTLTLNGQAIRDKGEMLSLTDMWKAAGSQSGRAPNDWRALSSTADFADHVASLVNAGFSGNDLFKTARGGSQPGTWAHWQMAIAYAKYLSPEFHAACNVVIRERMEGRHQAPTALPADLTEAIERTFGISRMAIHKITELEKIIPMLRAEFMTALVEADPRITAVTFKPSLEVLKDHDVPPKGRRGFSQKVSNRLRRYSLAHKHPMRESHETGRWLFHVDAIAAWVESEGKVLIRNHKAKLAGDGELFRLVK